VIAGRPPRPGGRRSPRAVWSRGKVVGELRRLDRAGASTGWAELLEGGRGALVRAAASHAGGLGQARAAAGVVPPARQSPVPRWDRAAIVAAIRRRARAKQALASSKAPQRLVAAARWHFRSWRAALAAAGVDPDAVRLVRAPLTRDDVLARIRELARGGIAVRPSTLRAVVKLDTVRALFGSVAAAVAAAGIGQEVVHGNRKWSRATIVAALKARASRGETRLTRGLARAVQLYFGGARAARAAAGLPAPARGRPPRRR
jgi:lambda repressor-like predicted transcriptional regulator